MNLLSLVMLAAVFEPTHLAATPSWPFDAVPVVAAEQAKEASNAGFLAALRASDVSVGLRYRVESVDDDPSDTASGGSEPALESALASTLRTELRLDTGTWRALSAHLAIEDVTVVGGETFNNIGAGDLANRRTDRAVVADPDNTEVSQAFLTIEPNERFTLAIGRKELAFGEQRFVGPVGWRQNHQEFDAIEVRARPTDRLTLHLAFLDRVHTITGADLDTASSLVSAVVALGPVTLHGYGYWLDYDNAAQSRLSSATAGLRVKGSFNSEAFGYKLEIAEQRDNGSHPDDFKLAYQAAELVWSPRPSRGPKLTFGIENLEGDGRNGFRTPLATLHKFNGFADRFLATPQDGLRDLYLGLAKSHQDWRFAVTYHRFEPEHGAGPSYGDELDAVVRYLAPENLELAFKAALYEAGSLATDITKLMVFATWGF